MLSVGLGVGLGVGFVSVTILGLVVLLSVTGLRCSGKGGGVNSSLYVSGEFSRWMALAC